MKKTIILPPNIKLSSKNCLYLIPPPTASPLNKGGWGGSYPELIYTLIKLIWYKWSQYFDLNPLKNLSVWIITILLLIFSLPSSAQVLKLDSEKKTQGQISKGNLTATIRYEKVPDKDLPNLVKPIVQVKLDNKLIGKLQATETNVPDALVQIAELDLSNPYPEVLLSSFTGGAHCCNEVMVLTSDKTGKNWRKVDLGLFDGASDAATDIDGDGRYEYVTYDNRFLYLFSSYAGSAAPTQIWQLNGDKFVDVSRQPKYKFIHRKSLNEMSDWFKDPPDTERNGFLAAYVANKALVGELSDGWQRMLKLYDKKSDWGLTSCPAYDDKGNCRTKEIHYKSYPEALRAFLIETQYIKPSDLRP